MAWQAGPVRLRLARMRLLTALLLLAGALFSRTSHAQPPDAGLLARLAVHAAAIERMRTHASYAIEEMTERKLLVFRER